LVFSVEQQEGTTMGEQNKTLYERLGGYDAIAAVANDLVARLNKDPQLGRFWAHRGEDGIKREKQLLIDFLRERAGGPTFSWQGRTFAANRQSSSSSQNGELNQVCSVCVCATASRH
jgi:hemoglobin